MLNNFKEFKNHFVNITPTAQNKWSENIFNKLKPALLDYLYQAVLRNKVSNKGPKPSKDTINAFLDALFELLDNGSKYSYLFKHHKISKTTFYKYFNLLVSEQISENILNNLLKGVILDQITLLDSSHIRSIKGSDGFKEKGKKALKLTVLASVNKVVYFHSLEPDNCSDIKAFTSLSNKHQSELNFTVLADKGYVGKEFKDKCLKNGHEIICPPKKLRNGASSHILTQPKKNLLRLHRCKVEHIFAQLKSYSAIQIKRVRTLKHFDCLVSLAILLTSIHNGVINGGLKSKTLLKIRKIN